jgi:CheY-like chemotaxis protein
MQKNNVEGDSKADSLDERSHDGRGIYLRLAGKLSAEGNGMDKYTMRYPGNWETEHRGELSATTANRLLLHVDDDPDVAFLLERALQINQMGRWSFLYRASGAEAVEYLQRSMDYKAPVPNLLVLDIKMPGMDGLEVLEWLSANMPGLPAVILSSSGLLEDRLRARDLGSKGYFEKSAMFSELIEFLHGWENFQFQYEGTGSAKEVLAGA